MNPIEKISGIVFGIVIQAALAGAHAANPVTTRIFTADPAALVDNGRVYLYVGHDEAPPGVKNYVMNEWRVFSSCDMQHWTEHPAPIPYSLFAWSNKDAFASDIAHVGGKYYFFAAVHERATDAKAIGVAVSDSPTGPFRDAIGKPLITNAMTLETDIPWDDIDPAIFVDDDGTPWLFWGNQVLKYAKLKKNMVELDGPIHNIGVPHFIEAPYVHKHGGTYYLSYSRELPEFTVYATSASVAGPWRYRGKIMDKNRNSHTIHHAIVDFNGKSYIVYHNAEQPTGSDWRRSVAVEEFRYNPDGTIPFVPQTKEGPAPNPSSGCR